MLSPVCPDACFVHRECLQERCRWCSVHNTNRGASIQCCKPSIATCTCALPLFCRARFDKTTSRSPRRFPGLGYATAIFATYCACEWVYLRINPKSHHH